jgi:1-acyl-sn-glycerol-3-phosphate acyltransferase
MRLLERPYPRRLLTVPLVGSLFLLLVTGLPLWALAAAAVSPRLPGRLRPLRLLWFLVVYLGLQVAGITVAILLWVAAGFGRSLGGEQARRRHYRLLGALLAGVMRTARRAFKLRLDVEADPSPEARPEVPHDDARPLIVLARHAGPGDSFLLVHELLTQYGRHPRIVLKAALQWDPMIDVLLNRLPNRFIASVRAGVPESIAALARDMGPEDALLIFPEGANFTEARRRRGIERLESEGEHDRAARARELSRLLPPRPAGTFAAIDAAPHADIVFVAHTGLEHLSTLRDLWRGLPMDADVRARLWTVPHEDVPVDPGARLDWLNDWWERIDTWIEQAPARRQPGGRTTDSPG